LGLFVFDVPEFAQTALNGKLINGRIKSDFIPEIISLNKYTTTIEYPAEI